MFDEKDQMELDFGPAVCKCNGNTKYEDLCPVCLDECLEYMNSQDDYDYEEHA